MVNKSARRSPYCGRQSLSAGRVVSALVGVTLGLGVSHATAADRLKHDKMPVGLISLAPSLDELGWSAPRFSIEMMSHKPTASGKWYGKLAMAEPQTAIASVFESRFNGFSAVAATAPPRSEVAAILKRERAKQALALAMASQGGAKKPTADTPEQAPVELAYADSSPAGSSDAFAALSAPADGAGPKMDVYADLPLAVPLPVIKPGKPAAIEQPAKPASVEQPDEPAGETPNPPQARKLALAKPESPTEPAAPTVVSKPGNGEDRPGFSLRDLFGTRRSAGNGVAVYDISAAKVYMPDGTVLEAHSGIGNMADDPRYVNVKKNGPTPPHTYKLKMRETRFHGVEAIRMLPIDGRNKYGRDGFLTHSYLLRGRAAQSHGCVAFKDYPKFLKAFKNGKVTQIVVVTGGGKAVARANQKGRDT